MPMGYECRTRLLKQIPLQPTQSRKTFGEFELPGPSAYEPPQIFCGNGFSKIKRSPAYTFGLQTPVTFNKPAARPTAPLFNVDRVTRKGRYKVPGSVVTPAIEGPRDKLKVPGPRAYDPIIHSSLSKPPAYTMRIAAKPPYQPWDMWTPPPNMYCPPIPAKKPPAYSLQGLARDLPVPNFPGPGEHDINLHYGKKRAPRYSFGVPFRPLPSTKTPPPNNYCNKLFMANKRTIPAPSFGIKHSQYAGQQQSYLKPEDLQIVTS